MGIINSHSHHGEINKMVLSTAENRLQLLTIGGLSRQTMAHTQNFFKVTRIVQLP